MTSTTCSHMTDRGCRTGSNVIKIIQGAVFNGDYEVTKQIHGVRCWGSMGLAAQMMVKGIASDSIMSKTSIKRTMVHLQGPILLLKTIPTMLSFETTTALIGSRRLVVACHMHCARRRTLMIACLGAPTAGTSDPDEGSHLPKTNASRPHGRTTEHAHCLVSNQVMHLQSIAGLPLMRSRGRTLRLLRRPDGHSGLLCVQMWVHQRDPFLMSLAGVCRVLEVATLHQKAQLRL